MENTILKMSNISKSFSGVQVLDGVNFELRSGEVHVLMGENGAGKSTLMKILTGVYKPNDGDIYLADETGELKKTAIENPKAALALGISMVFQEFNLMPNMSIAENISIGFEPTKRGVIDWNTMNREAEKMLAKVGKLYERSILEPSAGKGDLADAAVGKLDRYYNRCREVVHCIEIEPELQAAIRGKGYPLVGTDFLTFWPDEKYDLILMNPPFASGEAHLLHAWEILDHGDIVCLLNEQTLLNPCTVHRKLLATIIEEHGEVEHLGSCFAEDALRKTQVRVSMVHLRKKQEEPKFSFDAGSDEEGAAVFSDGSRFEGEVATRDTVGNLVAQYGRCRELFVRIAHLAQELAHYAGPLGTDGGETVGETLKELMRQKPTRRAQEDAYNRFVRSLKKSAWREVLRLTDVRNLASYGVQKEIDRILESNERMAFSEENVYALVESIFLNRGAILQQCVVEAFDLMTR